MSRPTASYTSRAYRLDLSPRCSLARPFARARHILSSWSSITDTPCCRAALLAVARKPRCIPLLCRGAYKDEDKSEIGVCAGVLGFSSWVTGVRRPLSHSGRASVSSSVAVQRVRGEQLFLSGAPKTPPCTRGVCARRLPRTTSSSSSWPSSSSS